MRKYYTYFNMEDKTIGFALAKHDTKLNEQKFSIN